MPALKDKEREQLKPAAHDARLAVPRPSDIFSGATVKRKFVTDLLAPIGETATAHETFVEVNMISSRERDEWTIPAGKAVRTPSSWGNPSSLYIEGEEARARIMLAMGIDLRNSRTYRQFS